MNNSVRNALWFSILFLVSLLASPLSAAPQKQHVDLLVNGGTVITMDAGKRVIEDGAVAVRG